MPRSLGRYSSLADYDRGVFSFGPQYANLTQFTSSKDPLQVTWANHICDTSAWKMWVITLLLPRSSPGEVNNFLFSTSSRPTLGPTRLSIQWAPGALSPGVKRPGCEAGHSPPSSAEVKKMWIYTSTPPYVFMAQCLIQFYLLYLRYPNVTSHICQTTRWYLFPGACYVTAYVILTDSINLKILEQNMATESRGRVYSTPA
jgi:hypothetical protein